MDAEKFFKETLSDMGFTSEKIEREKGETPDYLLYGKHDRYLVEVKSKFDDPDKLRKLEQELSRGQVTSESYYTYRKNAISKKVSKAADQLRMKKGEADFCIVWLMALGNYPDIQMQQFESALYGTRTMVDWDSEENRLIPCYYFDNSDFFNHRDILDGAVVSTLIEGKLCLNTLSPRHSEFKESEFRLAFCEGVVDPEEEEKSGISLLVNTDIDRKDKAKVRSHVQRKYGKPRLTEMDMGHHIHTIRLDKNVL